MLKLLEEDQNVIRHLGYPKIVKLSIGSFMIKMVTAKTGFLEVIGPYLGRQMGLEVPVNHLVLIDQDYYILSEDLNQKGNFLSASQMFHMDTDSISLLNILNLLKKNNMESNEINVIKMYLFDIFFHNLDRRLDNWGFLDYHIVMFDYDCMFGDDIEKSGLYFKNCLSMEKDLELFLKEVEEKYILLFQYYYTLFAPEQFNQIINQMASQLGIDFLVQEEIINLYLQHYQKIRNIYEIFTRKGEKYAR